MDESKSYHPISLFFSPEDNIETKRSLQKINLLTEKHLLTKLTYQKGKSLINALECLADSKRLIMPQ